MSAQPATAPLGSSLPADVPAAPERPGRRRTWAAIAALGVVAVLVPFGLGSSDQTLYATMGTAVLTAIGLSLLLGYAGQISIGQGAFYAFGAYVAGLLASDGWPTLLTLLIGPLASGLVALLVGLPLLRLRSHALAFATLALHLILLSVIFTWDDLTGGQIGLSTIPPLSIAGMEITGAEYSALVWVVAIGVLALTLNLVDSRAGRGMRALAAGDRTAAALGVNVMAYKVKIFVLAAMLAGLGGALYTYQLQFLSPDAFPFLLSVTFVLMVAIGGLGSIWGTLVGAIAITLLQHELQDLGTMPGLPLLAPQIASLGIFGLILTGVMLFAPRGLLPTLGDLVRRRRQARTRIDPDERRQDGRG